MAIAQCQSVPCGVHFITSPRTVARKLPSLLTRGGGVGVASFYNVIICSVSGHHSQPAISICSWSHVQLQVGGELDKKTFSRSYLPGSWDKCTGPEGRYMCRLSCIHSRSWRIFI